MENIKPTYQCATNGNWPSSCYKWGDTKSDDNWG